MCFRESNGKVYLKEKLDYETNKVHLINIEALDKGPNSLPGHASVVIKVEDVNDNPPEINMKTTHQDGYSRVAENQGPGKFVAYVSVTDKDVDEEEEEEIVNESDNGIEKAVLKRTDQKNKIKCHLEQDDFYFTPQLTYQDGFQINTHLSFDREINTEISAQVVCTDSGLRNKGPYQTSSVQLTVSKLYRYKLVINL